jgi:hypothetical protein
LAAFVHAAVGADYKNGTALTDSAGLAVVAIASLSSARPNTFFHELVSLCKKEAEFKRDNRHPKLARFLGDQGDQIDKLAKEFGFRDDQIQQIPLREFCAEKSGDHIVRLLTE